MDYEFIFGCQNQDCAIVNLMKMMVEILDF